jgi:Type IX secretion system protein PorV
MRTSLIRALIMSGTLLSLVPRVGIGQEPVGQLLQLPAGARAIGMGMAHGAVADGPDAGYWNPAALAFIEAAHSVNVTYSRLESFLDSNVPFVHAAYAVPTEKLKGALAVSFAYFDFGEATDQFGDTWRPYELAPAVAYGGRLSDDLAIGLGFKMYRIDYSTPNTDPDNEDTDNTFLLDGGFLWRGMESKLLIGGSIQNLGPDLEIGSDPNPPARNIKLAFGSHLVESVMGKLIAAFDVNIPIAGEDNGPRLMVGGEMRVGEYAAMRIGFRYDGWFIEDDEFTDERDQYATAMGFGIRLKGLVFDYANAPWSVLSLENSHHITLGAQF